MYSPFVDVVAIAERRVHCVVLELMHHRAAAILFPRVLAEHGVAHEIAAALGAEGEIQPRAIAVGLVPRAGV